MITRKVFPYGMLYDMIVEWYHVLYDMVYGNTVIRHYVPYDRAYGYIMSYGIIIICHVLYGMSYGIIII